ncbi:MAG: SGNH/GDSL hydrolase family protein [Acidobacteria bacterium]|nr:SGNH/GDSL hydrolase family protein [Acidobacteriota bacterium]
MSLQKSSGALLLIILLSLGCGCSKVRSNVTSGSRPDGAVIYAAVGDSTGAGLGARQGGYVERLFARIKQARPASRLNNRSLAGANTAQVLQSQVAQIVADQPTLVTVGIGLNDLLQGVTEDEFAKNYEEIVSRLLGTHAFIIITTLPDLSAAPAFAKREAGDLTARLIRYNQRIETIAARYGVELVDVYNLSREALHTRPELFGADGLHPSDAGYEYWAETLWPAVNKAIN